MLVEAEFFSDFFLEADDQMRGPAVDGQVDFIVEALDLSAGGRVLDLACGTGRHSIALAKRIDRLGVVGFDLTAAYLEKGRASVPANLDVDFVQGDMRVLGKTFEPESFDAVLSMHTSFGLFSRSEELGLLEGVRDVLRSGGSFLLDVTNRDWFLDHWGSTEFVDGAPGPVVRDFEWVDESLYAHEEVFDPLQSTLTWTVTRLGAGKPERIGTRYRIYSIHEVIALLGEAGLELRTTFGDYSGSRFEIHSPRIICVAGRLA